MATYKRRKRRRVYYTRVIVFIALCVLLIAAAVALIFFIIRDRKEKAATTPPTVEMTEAWQATEAPTETAAVPEASEAAFNGEHAEVLKTASVMAQMYDFDGAVKYIQTAVPDYASDQELSDFVYSCEAEETQLVRWSDNSKITHIFFHTLIYDNDTAFASYERDDYNQVMTTIGEFKTILSQLYERGYVLVRLSDIADFDPVTGQMTYKDIYLPKGKTPFVLSEDDVCYYEYMKETGGYANRLVIDENGRVVNEIDQPDGSVIRGSYDVVPIVDDFVEEHPDFSYHGAKGVVALTGYNGILGYRTSYITYGSDEDYQRMYQSLFVGSFDEAHAVELAKGARLYVNPNIEADRATAAQVAEAMKNNGWDFASHTWGHMDMSTVVDQATGMVAAERFYRDTQWWQTEVAPLIGGTDKIIFAKGADIGSWRGYTDDNQAYQYLKSMGFSYYCNVDSSRYFVQMSPTVGGTGYFRQGRRNLDGLMFFKAMVYPEKELLDDIIDVWSVFDFTRPLPVKGVTLPEGFGGLTLPDGSFLPIAEEVPG